jgi:GT2 family glycosyltransferase
VPKVAFTDWIGYYPDLFFRSAGETFLCKGLWESGKPVKLISKAVMYHELAMEGRSNRLWKFYGLRSQILCVFMRDPWILIPAILISKFIKSLVDYLRWGALREWITAWIGSALHLQDALALRRPISLKTYRLLAKLQKSPVSRIEDLKTA